MEFVCDVTSTKITVCDSFTRNETVFSKCCLFTRELMSFKGVYQFDGEIRIIPLDRHFARGLSDCLSKVISGEDNEITKLLMNDYISLINKKFAYKFNMKDGSEKLVVIKPLSENRVSIESDANNMVLKRPNLLFMLKCLCKKAVSLEVMHLAEIRA